MNRKTAVLLPLMLAAVAQASADPLTGVLTKA
jgi:hypothetical protein